MSITTRSRIAVCIATLLIVIGFSSPAFAKEGHSPEIVFEVFRIWVEKCHSSWGKNFPSEEKGWSYTICHPWAPVREWWWKTEVPPNV
jgi:hypothetical protein